MMRQKTFNELMRGALNDEAIFNRLGDLIYHVVIRAMADALTAEVKFEDGKSELGRVVEKTEVVNLIEFLARYIPGIEGALRGVQADVDVARNRAVETRNIVGAAFEAYQRAIDVDQIKIKELSEK